MNEKLFLWLQSESPKKHIYGAWHHIFTDEMYVQKCPKWRNSCRILILYTYGWSYKHRFVEFYYALNVGRICTWIEIARFCHGWIKIGIERFWVRGIGIGIERLSLQPSILISRRGIRAIAEGN